MTVIDGPSIHPLSGNKAKQLVIFCHGYGADGNDLIGLANYFQQTLKNYNWPLSFVLQRCQTLLDPQLFLIPAPKTPFFCKI